ncbi:MAG: hypothetical protein JW738_01730 [Actinobacteria bacterium]|nr:hypothetical protein [Actinomycetota bacterium]
MKRKLVIAFLRVCEVFLLGFFYFGRGLSYVLPYKALKAIYTGIGLAFYYFVPTVRKNLIKTLSAALPETTGKDEIIKIAKNTCCESIYATFDVIMFAARKEKFLANLEVVGIENYEEAASLNKGGLSCSCHLGAWTLSLAVPPHFGVYLTPIVYDPDQTMMPRLVRTLYKLGQSIGGDPDDPAFETGNDTIRRATEHIQKGKYLGVPVDVGGSRVVELFGKPAAMASGIAHFAVDTGAPILPANLYRGEKPYQLKAVIRPMLKYELTGDRETDLLNILQTVMKQLEEEIMDAPEQWSNWIGLGMWWKKAEKIQKRNGGQNS